MEEAMEVSAFSGENLGGVSTLSEESKPETVNEPEQVQAENKVDVTEDGAGEAQVTKDEKEESPIAPPQTQEAAAKTLDKVGLDIGEFEQEFMTNGELSQSSYEKLQKAGIPKVMVDSYIKGQEAIAAKFIEDIYSIAGGEQQYRDMTEWAAKNMPEEDVKAFNQVLASNKKELISLAVTGIVSRWKASEGAAPKLTQGRASAAPKRSAGFASSAEMVKAMQDKRYGRDAAYTREVENKVARSQFFG